MPELEPLVAFEERTPRSRALDSRLRAVMPAGETRSVTFYRPYPVVLARGLGAEVTDVDGNTYIDVLNNYTSLVHGHAFRPIVEAATSALAQGSAFPSPTAHQLALAETITARYGAVESVRFTNSGTEASLLALRIARHATGRSVFIMFAGGYHGTAPEFADASLARRLVPYNDLGAFAGALDESVAAVFAEPFLGSGGVIPAQPGFLLGVEEAARKAGAVFILDEVQSLRNAFGGMQAAGSFRPDLVTLGKIIGGGFPVGAVGGRNELMQLTAADRPDGLRHSGTFNGNPVTSAAGVASLKHLTAEAIARLNRSAELIASEIASLGAETEVPLVVTQAGSILHVHLIANRETTSDADFVAVEAAAAPDQGLLHLALLNHGVYAAPRGMLNLSTALSDSLIERVISAYGGALRDVAQARRITRVPAYAG